MAQAQAREENFANLLDEYFQNTQNIEGNVVKGVITAIQNDFAIIDVGLKSEGRIPLKEFSTAGTQAELRVGDEVEVYVEKLENRNGEAVLSREKALREESWVKLERAYRDQARVDGVIFGRVKGGFTVDLDGAVAFLPGSQVDIRPVRDVGPLMGVSQPFQILKMDRKRGNIVVSRRAVLEEKRAEARGELLSKIEEGQILDGIVKNITDYGAFIDMGGVDGLLHVTDISWKRVNHPSEALTVGQPVKVQVIKFDQDSKRVSLGMKQLTENPWEGIQARYPVGAKLHGVVTNITDYGAFVEIESGVEGLVHVSEMSWTKKNVHPGKLVSVSQEVDVMVLDIDPTKHRISLGIKQCEDNPWAHFAEGNKEGDLVKGEIKNVADFGLFIGLDGEIDGLVHSSDISWTESPEEAIKQYSKGQVVEAKILAIDPEKERISLGIKQLTEGPAESESSQYKKGQTVTCVVTVVQNDGIEVKIADHLTGFIKKSELSRDRQEQRPERFAVGDRIDAKITSVEKGGHKLGVSIKALEADEHKKAIQDYGSSDSGAKLGDILGAALEQAQEKKPKKAAKKADDEDEEEKPAAKKKAAKKS